MCIERDELQQKIAKLQHLLFTPDGVPAVRSEAISETQWKLLIDQYNAMTTYEKILAVRLQ